MIDFNKIKQQHLKLEDMNGMPYCDKCTIIWPCEVITILDEFEHFIEKIKFNSKVVYSWIKDYQEVFEVGDIVDFVNSALPEEFANVATIKDIESLPTYHLEDDDGRGWINVKQNDLTMIKKRQDKELVPHAHSSDCTSWRTCNCPRIVEVCAKCGTPFDNDKFNRCKICHPMG
jgi:hypothetical protein